MKEATGETNMTVVVILLIGIIVTLGTPIIRNVLNQTSSKADCLNKGMVWKNGGCKNP